jgi:ABC-type branched-subunit amino acid transport system substrate-binding protein
MATASRPRRAAAATALAGLLLVGAACSNAGGEPDLTKATAQDRELSVVPGFDGSTIHVGLLAPTSGPMLETATARLVGLKAFLDYITVELGGIGGKYAIAVDVRDSSDTAKVRARYAELRDSTVLLAQVQGRATVQAVLPDLVADHVLAGPSPADVAWPTMPNLLSVGTPDRVAAGNALAWLMTEGNGGEAGTRVCSSVQERADGEEWQAGLEQAAAELGVGLAPRVTVPAAPKAATGVRPQVDQLRQAGCTVVFLAAGAATTSAMLQGAATSGFAPRWMIPASAAGVALAEPTLTEYLPDHVLTVGDGPTDERPRGQAQMIRIRDAYAPGLVASGAFLEGYLQGEAIVTVLDAAVSRGDLSHAGLIEAAARLRSVRFDELAPDARYGPVAQRTAPTSSAISVPDPKDRTGLRPVRVAFRARFVDELAAPPGTP